MRYICVCFQLITLNVFPFGFGTKRKNIQTENIQTENKSEFKSHEVSN